MIDENHAHLPAVIAIDRSRRIEHRDAVIERKTGTGSHLRFEALGNLHDEACRYERPSPRRQQKGRIGRKGGDEVESRRAKALIGRQGQAR